MPSPKKSKKVTSAAEWKKSSDTIELEVPSGNICRVKRPGLPKLLADGVFPDALMPIMMQAQGGKKPKKAEIEAAISSVEGVKLLSETMSRVTAMCVVEPAVKYHMVEVDDEWVDIPEDERDPDVLYTDEVNFEDQMFIFYFVVGGTSDLEQFRKQTGLGLADVLAEQDLEVPSE